MEGDGEKFGAKNPLTRAEAATLLANLIQDEKVVFDDEIELEWMPGQASPAFKYYKVVLTLGDDANPTYPEDGYIHYIGDISTTDYDFEAGDSFHGQSELEKVEAGETYNIGITAVYSDGDQYYYSNVVKLRVPSDD